MQELKPALEAAESAPASEGRTPLNATIRDRTSLNAIIRGHPRERLYVKPIRWSSRHLNLLGCHWRPQAMPEPSHVSSSLPSASVDSKSATAKALRDLVESWGSASSLRSKTSHLRRCLKEYSASSSGEMLDLHISGKRLDKIQTDGVFRLSMFGPPVLAFVDLESLPALRAQALTSKSLLRHPDNHLLRRIREKKIREHTPECNFEDPWVFAVLILLAQKQRCHYGTGGEEAAVEALGQLCISDPVAGREAAVEAPAQLTISDPVSGRSEQPIRSYTVHVVALSEDRHNSYFYTASISASFLRMFECPSLELPAAPFDVAYCCVPLRQDPMVLDAFDTLFSSAMLDPKGKL